MHDTANKRTAVNSMAGQKALEPLAETVHKSSKAHFSMLQYFSGRSIEIL